MVDESTKLIVPGASWEMVKKIIAAYHAVDDQEDPSVESVADIAGKPRPLVSACNAFLRSVGLVQMDQNKLTALGNRFAVAVGMENESLICETLQQVVRESPPLARLIAILRARGSMKVDDFRVHIMLQSGMSKESRNIPFIKAILDLLSDGGLVAIEDDVVLLKRFVDSGRTDPSREESPAERELAARTDARDEVPIAPKGYIPTPFPLGPNRLAYLSLPSDWSAKELPKLLKMIELAFGGE